MQFLRRKLILGMASAGAVYSAPLFAAPKLGMTIRLWPDEDGTRISVESTKRIRYSYMLLRGKKPYRLVLDLNDVDVNQTFKKVPSIQTKDKYVTGVRIGQYKPDVMRVVFDLKSDCTAEIDHLGPVGNYGHRILINLEPTNAERLKKASGHKSSGKNRPNSVRENAKEVDKPQNAAKSDLYTVVIDPGHGGEDPGAVGRRKTYEKDVVLAISRKLAEQINATRGMRAIMTRNSDVVVPLAKRAGIAFNNHADFMVSVHADAWTSPTAAGAAVFVLSTIEAASLEARWLAQTQNRSDEIAGIRYTEQPKVVSSTLADMMREETLVRSRNIASKIHKELGKIGNLHKNDVERAPFAVLKAQGVPSILVEAGFLSNPEEEAKLRTASHQNKVATAIYKGILEDFKKLQQEKS